MGIFEDWQKIENDPDFANETPGVKEIVQRRFLAKNKDALRAMPDRGRSFIARVRGFETPETVAAKRDATTMRDTPGVRINIPGTSIGTEVGRISAGAANQFEQGTTRQVLAAGERLATGNVRKFRDSGLNVPEIKGAENVIQPSGLLEGYQGLVGRDESSGYFDSVPQFLNIAPEVAAGVADSLINIPLMGAALATSSGEVTQDLYDRMKIAAADPVEAAANIPVMKVAGKVAGPLISGAAKKLGLTASNAAAGATINAAEQVAKNSGELAQTAQKRRAGGSKVDYKVGDGFVYDKKGTVVGTVDPKTGIATTKSGVVLGEVSGGVFKPVQAKADLLTHSRDVAAPLTGRARVMKDVGKLAKVEGISESVQEGLSAVAQDYGQQGQVITDLRDQIALEKSQGAGPDRIKQLEDQLKIEEAKGINYSAALRATATGGTLGMGLGAATQLASNRGNYIRQMKSGTFLPPAYEGDIGPGLIATSKPSRRAKGGWVGGAEKAAARVEKALNANHHINQSLADLGVQRATLDQEMAAAQAEVDKLGAVMTSYAQANGSLAGFDTTGYQAALERKQAIENKIVTNQSTKDEMLAARAPLHNLLADVYGMGPEGIQKINAATQAVVRGERIQLPSAPAAIEAGQDSRDRLTNLSPFRTMSQGNNPNYPDFYQPPTQPSAQEASAGTTASTASAPAPAQASAPAPAPAAAPSQPGPATPQGQTAQGIQNGFAALGNAAVAAGRKKARQDLEQQGYVAFKSGPAADLFASQNPGWNRDVQANGMVHFLPPADLNLDAWESGVSSPATGSASPSAPVVPQGAAAPYRETLPPSVLGGTPDQISAALNAGAQPRPTAGPRLAPPRGGAPVIRSAESQPAPRLSQQEIEQAPVQGMRSAAKATERQQAEDEIRAMVGKPRPQKPQAPAAKPPRPKPPGTPVGKKYGEIVKGILRKAAKVEREAEAQAEADWAPPQLKPMTQAQAISALGLDPQAITEDDQLVINELRDLDADGNKNPADNQQERLRAVFEANGIPLPDKRQKLSREAAKRQKLYQLYEFMLYDPLGIYNLNGAQKKAVRQKLSALAVTMRAGKNKYFMAPSPAEYNAFMLSTLGAEYSRLMSVGKKAEAEKVAESIILWDRFSRDLNAPNPYLVNEDGSIQQDDDGTLLRNPEHEAYFRRKEEEAARIRAEQEARETRKRNIEESAAKRQRAEVEDRIAAQQAEQLSRQKEAELAHLNAEQMRLYKQALKWLDGKSSEDLIKILDGLERKIDDGDLSYRTVAYLRATVERLDAMRYSFLTEEMDGPTDVDVDTLNEQQLLDLWNGLLDTEWDGADEEWAMEKATQVRDRLMGLDYRYDTQADTWVKGGKPKPPSGPKKGRGKRTQTGKTLFDAAAEEAERRAAEEAAAEEASAESLEATGVNGVASLTAEQRSFLERIAAIGTVVKPVVKSDAWYQAEAESLAAKAKTKSLDDYVESMRRVQKGEIADLDKTIKKFGLIEKWLDDNGFQGEARQRVLKNVVENTFGLESGASMALRSMQKIIETAFLVNPNDGRGEVVPYTETFGGKTSQGTAVILGTPEEESPDNYRIALVEVKKPDNTGAVKTYTLIENVIVSDSPSGMSATLAPDKRIKSVNEVEPVKNLDELRLSLEADVGRAVSKMKQLGQVAELMANVDKKDNGVGLPITSSGFKRKYVEDMFRDTLTILSGTRKKEVVVLMDRINKSDAPQKQKDVAMLLLLRAMDAHARGEDFSTYKPGRPAPEKKPEKTEKAENRQGAVTEDDLSNLGEFARFKLAQDIFKPVRIGAFESDVVTMLGFSMPSSDEIVKHYNENAPLPSVGNFKGMMEDRSAELQSFDNTNFQIARMMREFRAAFDDLMLSDGKTRINQKVDTVDTAALAVATVQAIFSGAARSTPMPGKNKPFLSPIFTPDDAATARQRARLAMSNGGWMDDGPAASGEPGLEMVLRHLQYQTQADQHTGKEVPYTVSGRPISGTALIIGPFKGGGKYLAVATSPLKDSKVGATSYLAEIRQDENGKWIEVPGPGRPYDLLQESRPVDKPSGSPEKTIKPVSDLDGKRLELEAGVIGNATSKLKRLGKIAAILSEGISDKSKPENVGAAITNGNNPNTSMDVAMQAAIGYAKSGYRKNLIDLLNRINSIDGPNGGGADKSIAMLILLRALDAADRGASVSNYVPGQPPVTKKNKFHFNTLALANDLKRIGSEAVYNDKEKMRISKDNLEVGDVLIIEGDKAVVMSFDPSGLIANLEGPDGTKAGVEIKLLASMPEAYHDGRSVNLRAGKRAQIDDGNGTAINPGDYVRSFYVLDDGNAYSALSDLYLIKEVHPLYIKATKVKEVGDTQGVDVELDPSEFMYGSINFQSPPKGRRFYHASREGRREKSQYTVDFSDKSQLAAKKRPPLPPEFRSPEPMDDEDAALDAALGGLETTQKPDTMGSEEDALDAALSQLEAAPKPKKPQPPTPPKPPTPPRGGGGGGGGKAPPAPPAPPADGGLGQAMKRIGGDMSGADAFAQLGMAGLGAAAVISYLAGDPSANELAMASLVFLTPKQYEFFAKKGAYIVQTLNDTYAATRAAADRIRLDEWIQEFGSFIRSLGNDKITQVLEKLEASRDALIGMFKGSLVYRKKVKQYVDENGLDGVENVAVDIPEEIQDANPPSPPGDQGGDQGQGAGNDAADGGDAQGDGAPVSSDRTGPGDGAGPDVVGEQGQQPGATGVPGSRARGDFQPVPRLNPRSAEPAFEDLPTSGDERIDAQRRADYEAARDSDVVGPYVRRGDWSGVSGRSHPRLVVETRSLQGAPYPELTYKVAKPVLDAIQRGAISVEQADVIAAAGQANDNGHGILVADDVGLGKSREVAGIALDWLTSGKARTMVIITKGETNVGDLFGGQGLSTVRKKDQAVTAEQVISDLGEFGVTAGGPFPYPIIRMRNDNLKGEEGAKMRREFAETDGPRVIVVDSTNFKTFADEIIAMNPDALIADEAHMFRSKPKDSKKGDKWYDLHAAMMRNSQARFAYMTATPASDVNELFYLHGLREWPMLAEAFNDKGKKKGDDKQNGFDAWVRMKTGTASEQDLDLLQRAAEAGEIPPLPAGIMPASEGARRMRDYSPSLQEQVVREFKMNGKYIARDLWRGGVVFQSQVVERTLEENYNLQQFNSLVREIKRLARESVKGPVPPGVRIRASFVFAQIQAASKTRQAQPRLRAAVELAKKALAEGRKPVISVVSVSGEDLNNEPELTREQKEALHEEIRRITGKPNGKWRDLPADVRLDWLRGNLVAAIEAINDRKFEYVNEDGRNRLVDVGPIEWIVRAKALMLKRAEELAPTSDPVDLIKREFGEDNVTAITGKTPMGERRALIKDFQDGKRQVAVISGAGKTGLSLHHVLDESNNGAAGGKQSLDKNTVVSEFETSKGSVYKVFGDGTTQRDKAARPEHPGDSGIKERTSRTIYVDGNASRLSPAGIEGIEAFGVYLKNGKATLAWRGSGQAQFGASPSGRDVPFYDTPAVGRSPLELWSPKNDGSYTGVHAGNKIVKITPAAGGKSQPGGQREMIITDYEWTAPAVKQEMGRVDRAGQLTPPIITLLHTGSPAEKKFLATIASRMAGLGAVSKGQSDSTNTDALSTFEIGGAADNAAARVAMSRVFTDAVNDALTNPNSDEAVSGVEFVRDLLDKFTNEKVVDFLSSVLREEQDIYNESGDSTPDFRLEETASKLANLTSPRFFNEMNVREFLKELQMMPAELAEKAFNLFEEERGNDESAARYREDRATKKRSGRIVREYKVDDRTFYYDVEANDGSRFSILSGAVTEKYGTLQERVPGDAFQEARTYTTFRDERDGYTVTGLIVPEKLRPAVRLALNIKYQPTPATAFDDLVAGDQIPLANGMTLMPPKETLDASGNRLPDAEMVFVIKGATPGKLAELSKYGAFVPEGSRQVMLRGRPPVQRIAEDIGIADQAELDRVNAIPANRRTTINLTPTEKVQIEGVLGTNAGMPTLDIRKTDADKLHPGSVLTINGVRYGVDAFTKELVPAAVFNGAGLGVRLNVSVINQDGSHTGMIEMRANGKLFAVRANQISSDRMQLVIPPEVARAGQIGDATEVTLNGTKFKSHGFRLQTGTGKPASSFLSVTGNVVFPEIDPSIIGLDKSSVMPGATGGRVMNSVEKDFTALVAALIQKGRRPEYATADAAMIILKRGAESPEQRRVADLIINGVKKMRSRNLNIDVVFGDDPGTGVVGLAFSMPGNYYTTDMYENPLMVKKPFSKKINVSNAAAIGVTPTNNVQIFVARDLGEPYGTLAHEMIHAITVLEMTYNPDGAASRAIEKMYKKFKSMSDMGGSVVYGNFVARMANLTEGTRAFVDRSDNAAFHLETKMLANEKEFVAYALTDPNFQSWLQVLPMSEVKYGPEFASEMLSAMRERANKFAEEMGKKMERYAADPKGWQPPRIVAASAFESIAKIIVKIIDGTKKDVSTIESLMGAVSRMNYRDVPIGPQFIGRSGSHLEPESQKIYSESQEKFSEVIGQVTGDPGSAEMYRHPGNAHQEKMLDMFKRGDLEALGQAMIDHGLKGLREKGIVLNAGFDPVAGAYATLAVAGALLRGGVRGVKWLATTLPMSVISRVLEKGRGLAAIIKSLRSPAATASAAAATTGIYKGGSLINFLLSYFLGTRFAASATTPPTPYAPKYNPKAKRLSSYELAERELPIIEARVKKLEAQLLAAHQRGDTTKALEYTALLKEEQEKLREAANRAFSLRAEAEGIVDAMDDLSAVDPFTGVMAPEPAGINFTKLDTEQQVKDYLAGVLEEGKRWFFDQTNSKRRSFGQVESEALDKLKSGEVDIDRVAAWDFTKGLPTDAEMLAGRIIMVTLGERLHKLAVEHDAATKAGTITDLQRIEFVRMMELFMSVSAAVEGASKGIARALNAHKIWARSNAGVAKNIKELSEALRIAADPIDQAVERIAKLDSLFDETGKPKTDVVSPSSGVVRSFAEQIAEIWLAKILSAPGTHERNFVGFATKFVNILLNATTASAIGRLRGAPVDMRPVSGKAPSVKPEELRATLGEVAAMISAAWTTAPERLGGNNEFLRTMGSTYRTGVPTGPVGQLEARTSAFDHLPDTSLRKRYAKMLHAFSFDALQAADESYKTVFYRMNMARLAYRQAVREMGYNSKQEDLMERANDILKDPDLTAEMHDESVDFAILNAWQEPVGIYLKTLGRAKHEYPFLTFLLPFLRTPPNFVKDVVRNSPILWRLSKTAREDIAAGGVRADLRRAAIYNNGIKYLAVALLALNSSITGAPPSDPAERKLWLAAGNVPYAVKVGPFAMQYNIQLGSDGIAAGMVADFVQAAKHEQYKREMDPSIPWHEAAIRTLYHGTVNAFLGVAVEQTFMRGIDDASAALHDPARFQSYATNLVSSILVSNFTRRLADAVDPYGTVEVRGDTPGEELINRVQAGIPFARRGIPFAPFGMDQPMNKKLTPLGTIGGKTWNQRIAAFAMPTVPTREKNDVVFNELLRLNILPSQFGKEIGVLDPISFKTVQDERTSANMMRGALAYDILKKVIESPGYDYESVVNGTSLPGKDYAREVMIKKVLAKTFSVSKKKFVSKSATNQRIEDGLNRALRNKPKFYQ